MENKLVILAGNPNVGKSTVFNELTGMHAHTGNWIGKTVEAQNASFTFRSVAYDLVDLPGTYSLTPLSQEEKAASDFIRKNNAAAVVCIVDCSLLERTLPMVFSILNITNRVIVMLNLCDRAKKAGIFVDENKLSQLLGVPVVKATARSGRGINRLLEAIDSLVCGKFVPSPINCNEKSYFENAKILARQTVAHEKQKKICLADKILLGKYTALPSMALIFAAVLWLTVSLSNYPSDLLRRLFDFVETSLKEKLLLSGCDPTITSLAVDGILRVLFWVISVMLPPLVIFFPLFALLENFGLLPRMAFNFDRCFQCCGVCGKQALTCCMGLGCNAVGVTGARIIDSKRERSIAVVTNSLVPCNGRFPLLVAVTGMFFSSSSLSSSLILCAFAALSIAAVFFATKVLSSTVYKGKAAPMIMEMPEFRTPKITKTIIFALREKVLPVFMRAIAVAAPAGLVIWLLANIFVGGDSLIKICSSSLDSIGKFVGMDGVMLLAFILGFPANEIVLPIALCAYLSSGTIGNYTSLSSLTEILVSNGWDNKTALCVCIFSLFHFPCSTTLLTVYRETKSAKAVLLSVLTPLFIGFSLCSIVSHIF